MNPMTAEPRVDSLTLAVQRWKTIALFVSAGLAASLAYALLTPSWFEARITVVPSEQSKNALGGMAAKLPTVAAFAPVATDVQRIHAVLRSNSVADAVVEKFKLAERYDTNHVEKARAELWKHCSTAVDMKSGLVSLWCEDQDPQLAQQMTAYFGEVGNQVFGRVSASSAREERKFLETQLKKARTDVEEASRKLREFQEQHKVIDLPEQSKAVISAMASIQGDLMSKQLQLSYLRSFSSRGEANVVQLQQQIEIMEAKLKQLEQSQQAPGKQVQGSGSGSDNEVNAFFPDAMRVPKLRFELEQLFREQKIQETIFFLMTERFEVARIDEAL
jgi:tyrosine-protein kinase Etk/Wzc